MGSSVRWNDEQIERPRPYIGFVHLGDRARAPDHL
jgi:hypothetical protein